MSDTARPLGSKTPTRIVAASGRVKSGRSFNTTESLALPSPSIDGASMSRRSPVNSSSAKPNLKPGYAGKGSLSSATTASASIPSPAPAPPGGVARRHRAEKLRRAGSERGAWLERWRSTPAGACCEVVGGSGRSSVWRIDPSGAASRRPTGAVDVEPSTGSPRTRWAAARSRRSWRPPRQATQHTARLRRSPRTFGPPSDNLPGSSRER